MFHLYLIIKMNTQSEARVDAQINRPGFYNVIFNTIKKIKHKQYSFKE